MEDPGGVGMIVQKLILENFVEMWSTVNISSYGPIVCFDINGFGIAGSVTRMIIMSFIKHE